MQKGKGEKEDLASISASNNINARTMPDDLQIYFLVLKGIKRGSIL
jgi:hypothetical protein